MSIFLILLCTTLSTAKLSPKLHPLSDEFIDQINSVQNLWTAGRNFHPNTPIEYLQKLQGVLESDSQKLPLKVHKIDDSEKLPENFDSREKWPHCESLNEIRDQGNCGSCWATAATEVMTDRVCIHSNGTQEFHFSTIDLTTCGDGLGCNGGIIAQAWSYYQSTGIVSGGNYNSSTGCRPYPYRNCNHFELSDDGYPNCDDVKEKFVKCEKTCVSKDLDYKKDLRRAKNVYGIQGEEQIKTEIYNNGPVEASFTVYVDFFTYKNGVYKHTTGDEMRGHAVKIIGWGVENNVKYWLVANSWNEYWGDKGYFKILRGENHCGIESDISAGEPLLADISSSLKL